jgi:hypothetical protein
MKVNMGRWRVPLTVSLDTAAYPKTELLLKAAFWTAPEYAAARSMLLRPCINVEEVQETGAVRSLSLTGSQVRVKLFDLRVGTPAEIAVLPAGLVVFEATDRSAGLLEGPTMLPNAIYCQVPILIVGDPAPVRRLEKKVVSSIPDYAGQRRRVLVCMSGPDAEWLWKKKEMTLILPEGWHLSKVSPFAPCRVLHSSLISGTAIPADGAGR